VSSLSCVDHCGNPKVGADDGSSGGIINSDGVQALCQASCLASLQSARSTIAGACTETTDVIVLQEVAYPGISHHTHLLSVIRLLTHSSYILRRHVHLHVRSLMQARQVRVHSVAVVFQPCHPALLSGDITALRGSSATPRSFPGPIRPLPPTRAAQTAGSAALPCS
jgi:hypothetical protein